MSPQDCTRSIRVSIPLLTTDKDEITTEMDFPLIEAPVTEVPKRFKKAPPRNKYPEKKEPSKVNMPFKKAVIYKELILGSLTEEFGSRKAVIYKGVDQSKRILSTQQLRYDIMSAHKFMWNPEELTLRDNWLYYRMHGTLYKVDLDLMIKNLTTGDPNERVRFQESIVLNCQSYAFSAQGELIYANMEHEICISKTKLSRP